MTSIKFGALLKYSIKILPIVLIFIVALGIRVKLFWLEKTIAADGIAYVSIAKDIFNNLNFSGTGHFPPLYPILIGIFSYITHDNEVAGKVVSTIMGSLLIIPIYLLGKELFSNRVGYIASIIAALSPALVFMSSVVLSQSTYITILVTALYLCWKAFQISSGKMALAAGFMFGASYLTRPEAVIVFAGITVVFLFIRPSSLTRQGNLKLLLYAWAAFFILSIPYILLLHKINGTWQLTGKSSTTLADSIGWYLNRPGLKRELGFAGLTYLDIVKDYPDFLWKNAIKNIKTASSLLQPLIWLIALLGLVETFYSTVQWRRLLFIAATFLPLVVLLSFFFIDSNYFSPYLPTIYILLGVGLITVEKCITYIFSCFKILNKIYLVPWSLVFAIAIAIAIAAIAIEPGIVADRNTPYHCDQDGARYDHKLIGLMLKKYLPPKSRVMVKSGRIAYYGDFQQVDIPQATIPVILQAARNGKARFLIADGSLFSTMPQMEVLLNVLFITPPQIITTGPFGQVPGIPNEIRLVFLYKNPASVGVAVYELLGDVGGGGDVVSSRPAPPCTNTLIRVFVAA